MSWQEDRKSLFPGYVLHAAQAAERKYGIPACISLAQWAWESGYGKFLSGDNNPFGMKWSPQWGLPFKTVQTWEVINGRKITVAARFLSFTSLDQAFEAHAQLLADPKGPYKVAYPSRISWKTYLKLIGPIYATDPKYADALIGLINDFHLYDYNLQLTSAT